MDRAVFYIACVVSLLPSVTVGVEDLKPELITTENNDYKGYLDEFKGFQCQAKGTNLKYSWKHNDITIDSGYILKFPSTNGSTLQPLPVNLDDTYRGNYQCFVRNSIGTIFGRKALVEFTIVGDFLDRRDKETIPAVIGKPFAIHCPAHQPSQNVQYNWYYKEATSFLPLPSSDNYFVSDNGTLYFAVLREKDYNFINDNDGIVCHQQAIVPGSKMRSVQSHSISLRKTATTDFVDAKPEIKAAPKNVQIFIGSPPLVLKCGAIGYPIPNITWYRIDSVSNAEKKIEAGPDFRLLRHSQYLKIQNVGADKAGKYKCEAKNGKGEDEESSLVQVADHPQWKTGGELQDVQATLYSELIWTCSAFGGTTYHWFRNGVDISTTSPDGNLVIENKNSKSYLKIKNVTAAYNGMYQCTASNDLDIIYSTGRLQVKEQKPVFTEQMGPVILIRSRTGLIPCPVVASPAPDITWRKNGLTVLQNRKYVDNKRLSLAPNGLDLLISNVTNTDEGVYTCYAENRGGNDRGSSFVTVGADITWKSAPVDNRNVTITLRYEVNCEAEGDPSYEVKYRWLRNGLPLEYTARIHWVKEAHRLVILDAIVSDTGTYTCIASAETPLYIEKRKDVEIVVKAPADPPDIVWVVGSCWSQDAQLAWKVGALNNEEVYEYWIDWASTYNPSNWTRLPKVLEEDPKPVNLDFKLLPPFSQISFRVTVFNRIGAGEPSIPTDPSDCITKPGPPRFSPMEIKGVPGGPNTLKLEWTPVEQTFWGGPGFNYSVEWRRVTRDKDEDRWESVPFHQKTRIMYGNNNTLTIKDPGYYVEWEFRIRSNNFMGSAPTWTYNTSFSGQKRPTVRPTGLTPDRISARDADISWQRVSAPDNGSIDGYKIRYWHSAIGMDVAYNKNPNTRAKRDLEAQSETHARKKRDLSSSNEPRIRKRREDEDEDEEKEEPLDYCFNPDEPCEQIAREKESQLKDLSPYKEYHVRIAAFNSGGLGPWSNEFIFETSEAPPGPPYAVNTYAYDKYCKLTWKEPRHKNGIILEYEIYGKQIIRTKVPWWMRRHIIYELTNGTKYEAKIRARTSSGWGIPVFRWFQTHDEPSEPAKPLVPEVVGYGEDGVNVTFMEPLPKVLRKFGGELDEDPWEYRPVGGYEMENLGVGGYPENFYVKYHKKYTKDEVKRTTMKQMWGPRDQTWIVIENLEKDTVYEFATVPVNSVGEGPQSDWAMGLTGGIVPKVEKLHWYQRDWFIALIILFIAALLLLMIVVLATVHLKDIYYEGAPKRRKDRERERIYEPEDVDGGFNEFTLKSARSSRSVVTSRSEAPPPYNSIVGSASRHSGDFDEDEDVTDSDDEKHEVSTYYSDEKKVPLDDLDDDDEEDSRLATFV